MTAPITCPAARICPCMNRGIHTWSLRQTGAGQNRAMIRPMLKAGYGMEDIAAKTGLPVRQIRFPVVLLRESSSLSA